MAADAISADAARAGPQRVVEGLTYWNMPQGVTDTSQHVYHMHMMVTLASAAVGLVVFTALAWTIVRYRRSEGAVAAGFSHHMGLEVLWTLVPALILIAMAIPTTRALLAINRPEPASGQPALTVRITGSQWKWRYAYPDLGINFASNLAAASREASRKGAGTRPSQVANYLTEVDRPLVLPTDRPIRLQLTSEDVIHSWWVPQFGLKRDAIPGYINLVDLVIRKPGWYLGQCAELCGVNHAYMPIVVQAMPAADFDRWAAAERERLEKERYAAQARPWTMEEALAVGQKTYESICAACHQPNGEGIPGAFPALKGSAIVRGPAPAHIRFVLKGSPKNPVMRAFGPELDDRELAGVLTYERQAWGNDMGDLITPEEVKEAR